MTEYFSEAVLVAIVGGFGGILLGLAARMGRFCTLGAIEDYFYGNSSQRARMWGVAIGVAIMGSFGASGLGLVDLSRSVYLSETLNIVASVLGGLTFGYGMALAGNCGFGALARLGGGDLRSFVIVLVMGLSAYITLSGPLAQLRLDLFPHSPAANSPSLAHWLHRATGISADIFGLAIGAVIFLACLLPRNPPLSKSALLWGAVVGVAITSGWVGTSCVGRAGFAPIPLTSHTFSAPIGATMLYAMTASGSAITFGVGSVIGVLIGSFCGSLIKGHFRWEACEDPRELRRQILGAVLMGVGAVVALGCSIGQGMSAFSVLAISAPITLGAIVLGAYIGLHQLIEGFSRSAD